MGWPYDPSVSRKAGPTLGQGLWPGKIAPYPLRSILSAMRRTSYEQMNCSIASALDIVGEPWTLLIVRDAFYGVRRFDDFQENLGIARNVLTARLKKLVEAGIFRKTAYRERPLRHEYRLTDKGAALFPVIVGLKQWGDRYGAAARSGKPMDLVDHRDGRALEPVLIDAASGRRLELTNVRAWPAPAPIRRPAPSSTGWRSAASRSASRRSTLRACRARAACRRRAVRAVFAASSAAFSALVRPKRRRLASASATRSRRALSLRARFRLTMSAMLSASVLVRLITVGLMML